MLVIAYNMVTSFIGDVIPDTLLKVLLNTNKTVRHIIHNSWNIVDSGVNTNKNGHHVLHYTWHMCQV
jgi:hypothetical protein